MVDDFEITILSSFKLERIVENIRFTIYTRYCVYPTDFALLLGATTDGFGFCGYWCKSHVDDNDVVPNSHTVVAFGLDAPGASVEYFTDYQTPVLPAIKYSEVKKYINEYHYDDDGHLESVEFGEYPQELVYDNNLYSKLEKLYQEGKLDKTGKFYTTDSPYDIQNYKQTVREEFIPYEHIEYEYNGRKYIRVTGFENKDSQYDRLDYKKYGTSFLDVFWVQVEPIKWKIDIENDYIISSKALLSGLQYHYKKFNGNPTWSFDLDFEETTMYKYLNDYFKKEIIPTRSYSINSNYENNSYNDLISKKFK